MKCIMGATFIADVKFPLRTTSMFWKGNADILNKRSEWIYVPVGLIDIKPTGLLLIWPLGTVFIDTINQNITHL